MSENGLRPFQAMFMRKMMIKHHVFGTVYFLDNAKLAQVRVGKNISELGLSIFLAKWGGELEP